MNIVFFTGAGISAESGVKTFRDNDGLWNEYNVEDVATISAFRSNPERVLEFYNKRRAEMGTVFPNAAHILIATLQHTKGFNVEIITQNVDDLHERGGADNVIHLHGSLLEMKGSIDDGVHQEILEWKDPIKIGDKCPQGSQLRPNIVWFGESLPIGLLNRAAVLASDADVFVVVGTSLEVQPAAQLPFSTNDSCLIYYVDPGELRVNIPKPRRPFFKHIQEKATIGLKEVIDDIKKL